MIVRGLEPNTRQLYRVTKEGFMPELKHFLTGDHDETPSCIPSATRMSSTTRRLGQPSPCSVTRARLTGQPRKPLLQRVAAFREALCVVGGAVDDRIVDLLGTVRQSRANATLRVALP